MLALHINYVAGCTGPFLLLFERTHNYYVTVDNQGLVPWRLRRLGRSKVRSVCHGQDHKNKLECAVKFFSNSFECTHLVLPNFFECAVTFVFKSFEFAVLFCLSALSSLLSIFGARQQVFPPFLILPSIFLAFFPGRRQVFFLQNLKMFSICRQVLYITCSSAGRRFATSRSRLNYYGPLRSFPQREIR